MELWIRSQDKMNLVKVRQIGVNYQDNKQIIANYTPELYENSGGYYELLGTYKTKERALEVLNEIQKIIKWCQNDMRNVTIGDMQKLKGCFDDYVYEMPLE